MCSAAVLTSPLQVSVGNMHGTDAVPVVLRVRTPVPLTSAITAASLLALSLIMLILTCLLCRTKHKLCFKGELLCSLWKYFIRL